MKISYHSALEDASRVSRRSEFVDLRRHQPFNPLTFPFHDQNDLFEHVRLGERQEALRVFDLIHQYQLALPPHIQRMSVCELLVVVIRAAAFGGVNLDDLAILKVDFWAQIEQAHTPQLWDALRETVDQLSNRVSKVRVPKESELITWAKEYIAKRCRDKLPEVEVAGQLMLRPAYFSRLFKRETGYTFNDYLNRLRIRNATKDMADPALSLAEIAARNGYTTVQYFSSVFRRYVSMSPGQYRTLLNQGEEIADRFTSLQSSEI